MSDKFGYSDTGRGNMLGQHRNFHVIKNLLREGFIKKKWEFLDLKLIGSSLGFEGELIWAGLGWTGEVLTFVQGLNGNLRMTSG